MQITFKLYASLTDYLPADRRSSNQMALEVAPEATIADIIAPFSLPMKMVHLVLICRQIIHQHGAYRRGRWSSSAQSV